MRAEASRRIDMVVLLVVAAGFVSILIAATQFDPRYNPHALFGRADQCPRCHMYSRSTLEPTRFSVDCDAVCLGCHTNEQLGRSHPRNVRPKDKFWKMVIPEDFRLDDDGRMMCLTCHKAHGPFLSTMKAFGKQKPENIRPPPGVPAYYRTFFLRLSDPVKGHAVLCDACHKNL